MIGLQRRRSAWVLASLMASAPAWAAADPQVDPLNPVPMARDMQSAGATPTLAARIRDRTSEMVIAAMNFIGTPYRPGGSSLNEGFDCSGFTRHIFELSLGLVLPRSADDQASAGGLVDVERGELRPGDLVFFNTLQRTFSHVGIYVGEGRFIHSPRSGGEVRIENMRYAYWAQRYTGARRVAEPPAAGQATLVSTGR